MAIVITVAIEKGGNAKTTTTVNLAAVIAAQGKRVLVCDTDAQANTTWMLTSTNKRDNVFHGKGIYDMFRGYGFTSTEQFISHTNIDGIDIIPSTLQTPLAISQLDTLANEKMVSKNTFLARCLSDVEDKYDYILCDTPPTRDALTMSAIVASDYVLIPCRCDQFSMDGLETTYAMIERLSKDENAKIQLLGILLTAVEKYTLSGVIRSQMQASDYGNDLLKTEIRKGQAVNDSITMASPVVICSPRSGPSKDYIALWEELQARIKALRKDGE